MSEHDPTPTPDVPHPSADVPPSPGEQPPSPGEQLAWPEPAPRAVDDAATRRNWAAASHWSALAAAFLGGFAFLGPLVVWLVKRDQDRWVAAHAVESLNFQLTWLVGGTVAGIVGFLITLVTVGIALLVIVPLVLVAIVAWVVLPIRAALAASRAEEFRYPLTVRVITA